MCHLRLQIPRIRAGSVTRYRTGIAVTPENDDLSDVRLTRHRGAGRNDTSSSSIVYYYKGAPVYPDARPTPSPSKTGS